MSNEKRQRPGGYGVVTMKTGMQLCDGVWSSSVYGYLVRILDVESDPSCRSTEGSAVFVYASHVDDQPVAVIPGSNVASLMFGELAPCTCVPDLTKPGTEKISEDACANHGDVVTTTDTQER